MESVRLVIWDLDETFWHGTLTEGSVTYRQDCHDIVVELARRGIISSICSKNEIDVVRPILEENGIWQYFVFPSINWQPKGQRTAALIEAVQLRPASVMFIDDNPMNLAEAIYYVPELQTDSHEFIPRILEDGRFKGKNDRDLTRLAQYKILETRHADLVSAQHDNLAFLRGSGIQVMIEHDVESHLDRAVELVNRTNQLNFTKNRLPEDLTAAREQLRASLRRYNAFSGLIRVRDRYGDYGFVGLFVSHGAFGAAYLEHFCFSCRILNMGVETWVYRHIGRPKIHLAHDITEDITADAQDIDWIDIVSNQDGVQHGRQKLLDSLVMRGGCDIEALSHYIAPMAEEYAVEVPTARDDRGLRTDSSVFLNYVFGKIPSEVDQALQRIGFLPVDWQSALSKPRRAGGKAAWIFSFWLDGIMNFYQHQNLDVTVPFFLESANNHFYCDVTKLETDDAFRFLSIDSNRSAYRALKQEFDGIGQISLAHIVSAIGNIERAADGNVAVFIMLAPDQRSDPQNGGRIARPAEARLNGWIRDAVAGKSNFHLVNMLDFVEPSAALPEDFHFTRLVYKQTAEHIRTIIESYFAAIPSSAKSQV